MKSMAIDFLFHSIGDELAKVPDLSIKVKCLSLLLWRSLEQEMYASYVLYR